MNENMSRNVHCDRTRTPIYFYYRLLRLAPVSIYSAICSDRYRGYRRILNNAHQVCREMAEIPELGKPKLVFQNSVRAQFVLQPFNRINGSVQFRI